MIAFNENEQRQTGHALAGIIKVQDVENSVLQVALVAKLHSYAMTGEFANNKTKHRRFRCAACESIEICMRGLDEGSLIGRLGIKLDRVIPF
jgi:hypothetical protein